MILNYGHTFGHGIEGACKFKKIVHGEAVAIGMAMAAQTAVELGICSDGVVRKQRELLKKFGLPVSINSLKLRTSDIVNAMMQDKKKTKGKLRFVLPARIGKVIIKTGLPLADVQYLARLFGAK